MNATPRPPFVRVGRENFDVDAEYRALRDQGHSGAIVIFTGLVRDLEPAVTVSTLELQHYPGMTERVLRDIAATAMRRWSLNAVRIVHRIGRLAPAEQIVFVGAASTHRAAAFQGCEYIMDCLKTQAPFWKKIVATDGGERWADFKDSDAEAARRWLSDRSSPGPHLREEQQKEQQEKPLQEWQSGQEQSPGEPPR